MVKTEKYVAIIIETTVMRYFARSKVSRGFVYKKCWLDIASSFQVKTVVLSREVGYLL